MQSALGGDRQEAEKLLDNATKLLLPPAQGGQAPQQGQQQGGQQYQPPNQQQGQQQQGGYQQQPQNDGPPAGQQAPYCPNHNAPAKWVPGGFSQRTNKNYSGFWSCAQGDKSCKIRS